MARMIAEETRDGAEWVAFALGILRDEDAPADRRFEALRGLSEPARCSHWRAPPWPIAAARLAHRSRASTARREPASTARRELAGACFA